MKKNYFLSICLMLFMAVQATAQSFTIDQLFGKWQFTADVEFTDAATQANKETLSGNCEAVISTDENYIAKIVGFAGSSVQQNINEIGAKGGQDMVKVLNLNNPQLWSDLWLANENGDNPYGVFADGEWKVQSYGPVYYNVYATEGLITIPDFTVVKVTDYQAEKATVIAKYTNVKMTLLEAETVEVADVSGDYQFKAGAGAYSTMEGSVIPTEFAVTLAKTDENNKKYDATFDIEGYTKVTLPATFDGEMLSIAYNETYIDAAAGIHFADMYGSASHEGTVDFKSQGEGAFSLYSGFSFVVDSIGKNKAETADSVYHKHSQWYMDGTLKLPTEAPAFDWAGVYTVKTTDENGLYVAEAAGFDWPTEFQIEVEYNEGWDMYLVTKVFGMDVVALNYGGLGFIPAEDGKSVDIKTGYLYTVQQNAVYLALRDMNMSTDAIEMVVNEDGTMSVAGLSIVTVVGSEETLNAFYSNLAVTKEAAEPEAFDWLGTWEVTAGKQTSYDGKTYPESFYMTIEHNEGWGMTLITQFMSTDVAGVNYGGILLTIAADNKSAEMKVDMFAGGSYPDYLKIYDMNGTADYPVILTANEDGTISFDDFFLANYNWDTTAKTPAVFYENVTATKCPTGIEEVKGENAKVKGIFDMQGRKIDAITAPGLYIVDGKKVLVK